MADQEPHLRAVKDLAKDLNRDREDLGESRDELTDTLAELHRQPRALLEIPENELRWIVSQLEDRPLIRGSSGDDFRERVKRALAIETGPGGKFVDPA